MKIFTTFLLSVGFISIQLHAQQSSSLDQHSQQALQQTIELLNTKSKRDAALKQSQEGQANHMAIEKLTDGDSKKTDDIYKLSSDVLNNLVQQAGGDPNKMQQILIEAQSNPAAFAEKFTPEQKETLRRISSEIEKSKNGGLR